MKITPDQAAAVVRSLTEKTILSAFQELERLVEEGHIPQEVATAIWGGLLAVRIRSQP